MIIETRPWGRFAILYADKNTWLKRLIISPGQSLSLQSHEHRSEFWVTEDDGVKAIIGDAEFVLNPGVIFEVYPREKHRLTNTCDHEVCVLEWATGSPLESDITRYHDIYGRSNK